MSEIAGTLLSLDSDCPPDRPLSSTSVRARDAAAATAAAVDAARHAQIAKIEANRIAAIQRRYLHLHIKDLWIIESMSCPANAYTSIFAAKLAKYVLCTVEDILTKADPSGKQDFTSPNWVTGWEAPLHKVMRKTVRPKPTAGADVTAQVIESTFEKLDRLYTDGSGGPTLFASLVQDLTSYFDRADQADAVKKLSLFVVSINHTFADSLGDLKALVSAVAGSGSEGAPTDAMV